MFEISIEISAVGVQDFKQKEHSSVAVVSLVPMLTPTVSAIFVNQLLRVIGLTLKSLGQLHLFKQAINQSALADTHKLHAGL